MLIEFINMFSEPLHSFDSRWIKPTALYADKTSMVVEYNVIKVKIHAWEMQLLS